MKPKSDVFQLIKSLSKSEKRFFNLFSSINEGEKNYVKLFNVMDKMSEYDDEKLKKKLAKERFINNLSYEKNYLFKMLMRALRIFHDESDAENIIHNRLIDINILNEKGLYNVSREAIKKSIGFSKTHQKSETLLALLRLDTELDDRTYDIPMTELNIENHFMEINKCIQQIDGYNRYKRLYDSFWLHARQRKEDGMVGLRQIMQFPELKKYPKNEGFDAQRFFLAMNSSFLLYEGKIAESAAYSEKLIALMLKHPEINRDQPKTYFSSLNNLLGRYIYLGEEDKFFKTLEIFNGLPTIVNPLRRNFYTAKVAISSIQLELEYYLQNHLPKKAFQHLPRLIAVLKQYEHEIGSEFVITLNYTAAAIYFYHKQYKEAIRHIHRIINDESLSDQRTDLQCYSRLMRICCYHSMSDIHGMEMALKSFKKIVKNENINYESFKLLENYFSKASDLNHTQQKKELSLLDKKITAIIKHNEKEKGLLLEIDFLQWIRNNG